jgi:TM2 domain-containing membrane protein YozV
MNCVNHPELPAAAYCQNCGKALCSQCVRSVSGVIYCEQCLAARLGMPGAPPATSYSYSGTSGGVNYSMSGVAVSDPPGTPNPAAAFVLGIIPGVGAMYNGQFVKALVHVLVFVVLIGLTDSHPIFGIFIAAWVIYQVFDAYHTARARREGLPVPDPFGLNELGNRLGFPGSRAAAAAPGAAPGYTTGYTTVPPAAVPPGAPPPPPGFDPTVAGFTGAPYATPYTPYVAVPPIPPIPPGFDPSVPPPRREPIGAIVLIGLGVLFLLSTLGFFRFNWIWNLWPLFLVGLGVWLLLGRPGHHHGRTPPPPAPPSPPASGGAL